MALTSTEFGLLSDIASGIREGGRASGNTVPLSVYNELLARYREEERLAQARGIELEAWREYGNEMDARFDRAAAHRDEWKTYAEGQKARAERAEAELARLRGQTVPKAA